uniref:Uncharacterized protein n=1 Tax=Megaselia scalaris TaxID=36166 RepID=T1GYT3_MEGSC
MEKSMYSCAPTIVQKIHQLSPIHCSTISIG